MSEIEKVSVATGRIDARSGTGSGVSSRKASLAALPRAVALPLR
jgi:hypothetical protein